jgi:uncharacterized damage-inducible protein DinB
MGDEIIQRLRETRYITLSLADQITGDHWREPRLPGGRAIHDLLAHLLAWDEWAIAVFDMSQLRELPPFLVQALQDVDAYNDRAVHRFRTLTREDMLNGLQSSNARLLKSACATGSDDWAERQLPDLATHTQAQRVPSVGSILRSLIRHEAGHHAEISETYGVTASLPEHGDAGASASSA